MKKRMIALFLASLMVVSLIPASVLRADETAADTGTSTGGAISGGDDTLSFEEEADVFMGKVDALMAEPLTRERYEEVKTAYESLSEEAAAYLDIEKLNSFNQLRELMDSADKAVDAAELIQELKLNARETDYIVFSQSVGDAKVKVEAYYSKFATLRQNAKYAACLPRDIRNILLANFAKYDRAVLYLTVEEAYHDVGDFDVLTAEVKEKVRALSDAVDAAGKSDYQISVYDFYNGTEIKKLLDRTDKIVDIENALDELPANITDTRDLAELLRIFTDYNKLTEEEKSMFPLTYTTKLNEAVKTSTDCEEVIAQIDGIGILEGEEDFDSFCKRYEDAYRAYQSFIYQYRNINGIEQLIENSDKLDEETLVMELVKTIRQLEVEEDALRCSKLIQMEAAKTAYDKLDDALKAQIYNIDSFNTIYQDTKDAYAVRSKIEAICNNFSLADDAYVEDARNAYEALNSRAKAYVGDSKYIALLMAEEQLAEMNQNVAALAVEKINAIGAVTVNSKTKIETARTAYNGLTQKQKALVSNYNVLLLAEETYSKLNRSVANASVADLGAYVYNGTAVEPEVSVLLNGIYLQPGIDYRAVYSSNTKAGTAKVTITGIGNYTGTKVKNFTIQRKSLTTAAVGKLKSSYTYTGKKINPALTVKLGEKVLVKNRDYTVTFRNNKKVGKAVVVIKGIGSYSGTISDNFKIKKKSVKKAVVSNVAKAYARTGKRIKPAVKVKAGGVVLKKKRDYTVSYSNNVAKGKAVITIKGKGNYSGTKKVTFKIV